MNKFMEVRDGIWPMFISHDMRVYVTQYARQDWRVSEFAGRFGARKLGEYRFSSKSDAMAKAREIA